MLSISQSGERVLSIRSGLFTADLHLLSPRSNGHAVQEEIAFRGRSVDCIVLGGDIFDFRWSSMGSHDATLDATRKWLDELLAITRIPVVYLPGNHDCHPDFLDVLRSLAVREDRFVWTEFCVQIADCLFLHGDVLDAGGVDQLPSYRCKFHHELPQSTFAHRAYDMAVGMRIHKLVPLLRHQPLRTCRKLLDELRPSFAPEHPVHQIYFGHTHVPIDGLAIGPIRFFNPGATLRHMKNHILTFHVGDQPHVPFRSITSRHP